MKAALTDRGVLAVPAPPSGRATVWDSKQAGLCLRVTPGTARTFFAVARRPGDKNPTWIKVGSPPTMSVADARRATRAALVELARSDPKPPPPPPAPPPPVMLAEVAEDFLERHVSGLRTHRAYANRVRRIIALWGSRPISTITRRDIIAAIEVRIKTTGKNSARHLFSDLAAIFGFACDRDLIEFSPCSGVRAARLHGGKPVRHRVLDDDELRAVWGATFAMRGDAGLVTRLLLLSGQRRGEIDNLRWPEVDLGQPRIIIPGERMKMGKAHSLPLTPSMAALLSAQPVRLRNPRVFRNFHWSREKRELDRLSGVTGWVVHDLRRTARTGMAAAGVGDAAAERVLAHEAGGIVRVYNRHDYEAEKLAALLAWEQRLMDIVEATKAKAA